MYEPGGVWGAEDRALSAVKVKPLTILVTDQAMLEWPEVQEIVVKGHIVQCLESPPDIIIGPHCWRMTDELKPYFKLAIAEAKKRGKGSHE